MNALYLHKRLQNIEGGIKKRGASGQSDPWYQMRVSATNPPTTSVLVRGGWMQTSINWGLDMNVVWLPPTTCDFSGVSQLRIDANHVYDGFANPYWYKPVLFCWNNDYFWYLTGGTATAYPTYDKPFAIPMSTLPEYETAVEAEQGIVAWMESDTDYMGYYDMPLCIVVLRNDGTTGIAGAVQPIDAVNRDRSYLWRDMRERHRSEYYDGFY